MRNHPVAPLRGEQRVQFEAGPGQVHGGQADRVERGVPAPLMRVQGGGCPSNEASAVIAQYVGRSGGKSQGTSHRFVTIKLSSMSSMLTIGAPGIFRKRVCHPERVIKREVTRTKLPGRGVRSRPERA